MGGTLRDGFFVRSGPRRRPTAFHGGRSLKQAPSGRAGVRLRGLTWGVCSGTRRREAPCGKRPVPMSREVVLGVRPSTISPDSASIDLPSFLGNTENSGDLDGLLLAVQANAHTGAIPAESAEPWRMSSSETSISLTLNARIT